MDISEAIKILEQIKEPSKSIQKDLKRMVEWKKKIDENFNGIKENSKLEGKNPKEEEKIADNQKSKEDDTRMAL
jgi:hypothetical protein